MGVNGKRVSAKGYFSRALVLDGGEGAWVSGGPQTSACAEENHPISAPGV